MCGPYRDIKRYSDWGWWCLGRGPKESLALEAQLGYKREEGGAREAARPLVLLTLVVSPSRLMFSGHERGPL